MSLFLSTEEMFDLPLNGKPDTDKQGNVIKKRVTHWFGNLAFVIVGLAMKIAFRYKVINKSAIRSFKRKSGCIVIGNHESYLDAAFMFLSPRPSQWIRLMARENLFENNRLLGQIFARAGAFPVARDSADRTTLKRAVKMLKRGEVVGIMPEGTRRGKGTAELALHSGFTLIAKMAGDAPIVPCALRNVGKIKRKGERLRFPKVEVEYAEPLYLSDFDDFEKKERLEACAWYAMREVFAIRDKVSPNDVDMKTLFPESFDYSEYFLNNPRRRINEKAMEV